MHKKQTDQPARGGIEGIEGFLCGCCSAYVSLKSPYADFQQLLLLCVVPIERKLFSDSSMHCLGPYHQQSKTVLRQ